MDIRELLLSQLRDLSHQLWSIMEKALVFQDILHLKF